MKRKEKELEEKRKRSTSAAARGVGEYPPRSEVIECVRSLLQPMYDGRQIPPEIFVNVVKSVSSQFFQKKYTELDDWRGDLRTLVRNVLGKKT